MRCPTISSGSRAPTDHGCDLLFAGHWAQPITDQVLLDRDFAPALAGGYNLGVGETYEAVRPSPRLRWPQLLILKAHVFGGSGSVSLYAEGLGQSGQWSSLPNYAGLSNFHSVTVESMSLWHIAVPHIRIRCYTPPAGSRGLRLMAWLAWQPANTNLTEP